MLSVVVSSQPSGQEMETTIDFRRFDETFYVAVRAVDARGNNGRVSNIVQVYMPSPPTTTTSAPVTSSPVNSQSYNGNNLTPQWFTGGLSTVHWAAIVAGICVAILILILVVYFIVHARRGKEKQVKNPAKFAFVAPVTNTLYPSEKEKTTDQEIANQYKASSAASIIYDGKTVPVHWSASQLLQEHERRQSPYGHHESPAEHQPDGSVTYSNHSNYTNQFNIQSEAGLSGSRHSAVFSGSYHLNSASATYGTASNEDVPVNIYSSNGTASITPPIDSFASLPCPSDYRSYSVDYEVSSSEHQDSPAYFPPKPHRPPTFPKPDPSRLLCPRLSNLPLHGSFTSLASDRKKRNVTQV